jgi:hypothetical protein
MKLSDTVAYTLVVALVVGGMLRTEAPAQEFPDPDTYMPSIHEVMKTKDAYDDPNSLYEKFPMHKVLPPRMYERLTYDIDEMKALWAEVVGFRSPDVVGRIAPDIKPGRYTYEDLEKRPGLRELMIPGLLRWIKPGGEPFACNIPEFEVVPTRQRYYALPIAKATKENMGKTKQDEEGYLIPESYEAGIMFPRPSGQHKAMQVVYDLKYSYANYGWNIMWHFRSLGIDRRLREDFRSLTTQRDMQLAGRVFQEPFGYYDSTAKERMEHHIEATVVHSPRDMSGTAYFMLVNINPRIVNTIMIYVPSLRRIRKLSSTDGQDPIAGQDVIFDEQWGHWMQMRPDIFPYKYEVAAEREYLVPVLDGSEWIRAEGMEWRNVKFERRPMYVLELTQQDRNYIYGRRTLYVDKETLLCCVTESYDQKGRLYRQVCYFFTFIPEMGAYPVVWTHFRDYIDLHTNITPYWGAPAFFDRAAVSMKALVEYGK